MMIMIIVIRMMMMMMMMMMMIGYCKWQLGSISVDMDTTYAAARNQCKEASLLFMYISPTNKSTVFILYMVSIAYNIYTPVY